MNFERKVIKTQDGSSSLFITEWQEHYHSVHGAVQESYHVFIENGLKKVTTKNINILEVGFGTGLNALITLIEAQKLNISVQYDGLEAFPVQETEHRFLNYAEFFDTENVQNIFDSLFYAKWNENVQIHQNFSLHKKQIFFEKFESLTTYDLIYFDAFGARVQPELWTEIIFQKMYDALLTNGILVTYSAKGSVRRAMLAVGFEVEKLPGAPGKREMLRATKR